MKSSIKYLSFGLLAALTLASCSDEFLEDKKNYDNVSPEIYSFYSGANLRVNDIYSWCLPTTTEISWKYPSCGLDDMCAKSTEEYVGFGDFIDPEKELTSMGAVNSVPDWFMAQQNNIQEAVYGRIRNINDAIAGISAGNIEEDDKNVLLGQCYFFRAWCYYNLFKWYGGVPIVTEIHDPVEGFFTPRASAHEMVNFILEDLQKAADMLKERTTSGGWSGADYGRVTTGTALALKGRVLLLWASPLFNRANDKTRWTTAYTEMKADLPVINSCGYGLFNTANNVNGSDFAGQFLTSAKNPEAVFVTLYNNIASDEGLDNQKNNNWERGIRPANTGGGGKGPSLMFVKMFPMADGKIPAGTGTYTRLETSQYTYDDAAPFMWRDPRFYRTFAFPGFRWAFNGDATQRDAHNPYYNEGQDYVLWNYVWYTDLNDQGNPESGNSYAADNLLTSKRGIYIRKKSDDLDVNQSPLYNYSPTATKGAGPWFSAAPLIELRYAEVLLNLAEAACGAGDMAYAVELLQQIRARVGYTSENNYGLQAGLAGDQATCMSAILYERQIEFAYEGKRFDDMRRWMLFDGGATTVAGAPSTWTLTGWGGNTCKWLGFTQFNGQRRENIEFRVADKYGVGGTTYDSDPLLKALAAEAKSEKTEEIKAANPTWTTAQINEALAKYDFNELAMEKRFRGVDFRQNLVPQLEELKSWYAANLVVNEKRGDGYDANHNLEYINFRPKYYFLGLSSGAQSANKDLPQTIGWENYNDGGAPGTFDPLAETAKTE
ncbi:MAG: RagB/SusD family nutrient uptake outer membrane protein [Prevotella sp.]|nr:RagB/SusD family nutrient uptake outer membrane protein [Prevotella sp.]